MQMFVWNLTKSQMTFNRSGLLKCCCLTLENSGSKSLRCKSEWWKCVHLLIFCVTEPMFTAMFTASTYYLTHSLPLNKKNTFLSCFIACCCNGWLIYCKKEVRNCESIETGFSLCKALCLKSTLRPGLLIMMEFPNR